MLLSNLANPNWLSIDCDRKLLNQVLCRINIENKSLSDKWEIGVNRTCLGFQIWNNSSCWLFVWSNKSTDVTTRCREYQMINLKIEDIRSLFHVLLASSVPLSPVLSLDKIDKTIIHQFSFDRPSHKYKLKTKIINTEIYEGYQICKSDPLNVEIGISLFKCKDGLFISSIFLCNGIIDCCNGDTSDEQFCQCNYSVANRNCKEVIVGKNNIMCSELYYMANGACYQYTNLKSENLNHQTIENYIENHTCNDGAIINRDQLDDLYGDCHLGDDEPILKSLLNHHMVTPCANSNQIPCLNGHPKCYNISEICSYKLNKNGHLIPCRNGAHLDNCKGFNCNSNFKCPNYYCIPYEYVCDGSWDCPTGSDENFCRDLHRCFQMFKCKATLSMCIHLGNICDGFKNCPLGDDEFLCEIKNILCPFNCQCLSLVISCRQGNLPTSQMILPFIYVSLKNTKVISIEHLMRRSPFIHYLKLRFNNILIQHICICYKCNGLLLLDVANNLVEMIKMQCFQSFSPLKSLILNDNVIRYIEDQSFSNLKKLKVCKFVK